MDHLKLHDSAHDPDTLNKLVFDLLDGYELEDWIVETLQYPKNTYDVVGFLLRFGALTKDKSVGFNSFLEGRENPVLRAAAWARALSKEQLDYVEWLLHDGAHQTLNYLEALAFLLREDPEDDRLFWLVCMTRDDTENLRVLLQYAGRTKNEETIDLLDETSIRTMEELQLVVAHEPYDERLDAAALNEPGIWWGPNYGDANDDDWITDTGELS